jgi:hypothetical protein
LVGVFVESRKRGWAERLSLQEAHLAVRHSTLELNGFPEWLAELVIAQPQIVREVLSNELRAQVAQAEGSDSVPLLQTLAHADAALKRLLYPTCLDLLVRWDPAARKLQQAQHLLDNLLSTLLPVAEASEKGSLAAIVKERLASGPSVALTVTWLNALFSLDSEAAAGELETILGAARGEDAIAILAAVFGHVGRPREGSLSALVGRETAARTLGRLIRSAHRVAPPAEDEEHDGVYTPSERDHAASARSHLLHILINTPGLAARDELISLARDPLLVGLQERLRHLARERAAADSEFEALQPADIRALDARLEAPPRSRDALYALMMDRLEDLQHDVSHHDFSDRHTLQAIQQEVEMQRTLALRLETKSRENYSVFRESEAADAKRTDIVLAAAGTLQKAVIEIKVADTRWTLAQLEKALTEQLVQLYQRHDNCRAGCLLITNNGCRTEWSKGSVRLDWDGLLKHLRQLAAQTEAARNPALRVGVFGLDLRDPPLPR